MADAYETRIEKVALLYTSKGGMDPINEREENSPMHLGNDGWRLVSTFVNPAPARHEAQGADKILWGVWERAKPAR